MAQWNKILWYLLQLQTQNVEKRRMKKLKIKFVQKINKVWINNINNKWMYNLAWISGKVKFTRTTGYNF